AILIHAFVDEQSIGPRKRIVADSGADIDIEKSILIYVCECHTGVPLAIARDSRFFRYIFESKVAAIKVKSVWHHVAAEKDVGETIVIEIAHCHTCTVVHILYGEDVDRVSFQYCVFKIDTRFGRWHEPEQRLSSIRAGAGCDDRGEEENIKPKSHRAWHVQTRWLDGTIFGFSITDSGQGCCFGSFHPAGLAGSTSYRSRLGPAPSPLHRLVAVRTVGG